MYHLNAVMGAMRLGKCLSYCNGISTLMVVGTTRWVFVVNVTRGTVQMIHIHRSYDLGYH